MKELNSNEVVEVVQKFSGYINKLCRRYYIAGGTQDDLYEEGVIGLLEACKNYNGETLLESKFESFAKLCIKRQIYDAIKKANTNKNKALNESVSIVAESANESVDILELFADRNSSNDPQDLFLDKEKVSERLKKCEQELSNFEKQVLKHYLDGEKQSEIAKALGKEIKSIDNTIQRIKQKLK